MNQVEQTENMADWDLMCPILLDWLEDPIIMPCCGKAISKIPLYECVKEQLVGEKKCPNCSKLIGNFDILNAPISLNILNIVKRFKESNPLYLTNKKPSNQISSEWEGMVDWLEPVGSAYKTILGKLKLKCLDNKFQFKTLLIPVIDNSGSMGGSPITQCKYSLNRIVDLAYSNSNIITNIITYNDLATSILINTSQTLESYRLIVDGIKAGGGTSFNSAFNEIVRVCGEMIDPTITNVSIIFLTDGEDSSVSKTNRIKLVNTLKEKINNAIDINSINLQIHTIGFGHSHDYDFLNSLRQITKVEGAYRYADPTEDSDSLSNKINSLLDVISQTVSIPIKITSCPFPILYSDSPIFWLDLTECVTKSMDYFDLEIQIGSDSSTKFGVRCKFNPDENVNSIWVEWYTHLIDELMGEVIGLVNMSNSDSKSLSLSTQIHLELIEQRTKAVRSRIKSCIDESELESNIDLIRCDKIFDTVKNIRTGNSFDSNTTRVLNDLKFEGKFKTPTKSSLISNQNKLGFKAGGVDLLVHKMHFNSKSKLEWKTIPKQKLLQCDTDIVNGLGLKTLECIQWYETNKTKLTQYKDSDNMSFFEIVCSIGKFGLVEHIAKSVGSDSEEKLIKLVNSHSNKYGKTPLDLAIQNGYWKTVKILFDYGAKPNLNHLEVENLLRTCVSKKFWKTGEFMIFNGLVGVTEQMEESVPTQEGLVWLSKMKGAESIDIFKAISKSMVDVVANSLDQIKNPILWSDYMYLFQKPTLDQIKIIDILLGSAKASPTEIIDVIEAGEPEKTTLLYLSCEKGNLELFYTCLKHIPSEQLQSQINWQNLKGTSCLWIACCNKHTDIVTELLGMGADPNIVNAKGDSPLIPTCQKGSESIVQLLLAYGVDLEKFNPDRENAITVCCRNNQSKLLEQILNHIQTNMNQSNLKYYLGWCAQIDGFNPLLASVELGNIECVKVIYKYDTNLEFRSGDDNPIIAGSTPLHLASFYGRTNTVKTLIELGSDIYSQTTTTQSNCLHLAIKHGHKDLVRFLMDMGDKTIQLMGMEDSSGRVPEYYADLAGNEDLKEEFFTSKLSLMFSNLFIRTEADSIDCADILSKYSKSIGVYSPSNVTELNLSQGTSPLAWALLTGKNILARKLIELGSNIFKPDDRGITPYFWIKMLGLDMELLGINQSQIKLYSRFEIEDIKTNLQLERINLLANSNPQYKMLLQYKSDIISPLTITQSNSLDVLLLKMLNGFGLDNTTKSIELIGNTNTSMNLISFIEKLKTNKIIQLDENKMIGLKDINQIEYWKMLLLDAKINLIKIISTSTSNPLNPNQILSIYLYTANLELFKSVNQNLSNISIGSPWFGFIGCLFQGLKLLPNYTGECFRAVDCIFDESVYAIGNQVEWGGFSISNIDWKNSSELIRQKRGIVFIIKSKTGKNISSYSKYPQEKEIVFLPGTKFTVSNYYVPDIICLAQENIRNTTFKYNSIEKVRGFYDKALEGKSSIIIELKEI